jgi:gamma-glutamylcyclotransferase (GGCT)/AIG2-like uncharacterized protein YtfP
MNAAPVHLFAYGTLMQAARGWRIGQSQRDRLAREGALVGAASVSGRLLDLGDYPGLVLTGDGDSRVHGEVVHLAAPERSFRWLDAYEGIVPGDHAHNEYARIVTDAMLADGRILPVWLYVFQQEVSGRPAVPGGRWIDHAAQR